MVYDYSIILKEKNHDLWFIMQLKLYIKYTYEKLLVNTYKKGNRLCCAGRIINHLFAFPLSPKFSNNIKNINLNF